MQDSEAETRQTPTQANREKSLRSVHTADTSVQPTDEHTGSLEKKKREKKTKEDGDERKRAKGGKEEVESSVEQTREAGDGERGRLRRGETASRGFRSSSPGEQEQRGEEGEEGEAPRAQFSR
ncbi:UNVERIFIED_CONTAM: hypothetical protein HHA_461760 [Hammondia hammondi]|eukprot:XP_008889208.1 hypothetical protein HHA_461760 [Hammondia hammondi]